jgi:hypothetical protein
MLAERNETTDERFLFAYERVANLRDGAPVFVAKRQVIKKIFDRPQPECFELRGARRPDAL